MTKTNAELQGDVIEELAFDPKLAAATIGVNVREGVVTLSGTVRTFAEKLAAERAVKRVSGVRGIAEELKIEPPSIYRLSDTELAKAALNALKYNVVVPKDAVTVTVEDGWLTLEGQVDWQFEKDAAFRAVEYLPSLIGVSNAIKLKPAVTPSDVKMQIREAFERAAEIDAGNVEVEISDGTVTLAGKVNSWAEHEEAAHAAYRVPGVNLVKNTTKVG